MLEIGIVVELEGAFVAKRYWALDDSLWLHGDARRTIC